MTIYYLDYWRSLFGQWTFCENFIVSFVDRSCASCCVLTFRIIHSSQLFLIVVAEKLCVSRFGGLKISKIQKLKNTCECSLCIAHIILERATCSCTPQIKEQIPHATGVLNLIQYDIVLFWTPSQGHGRILQS
jgi:hypothetical protein